jgi:hypothetical protein
MGLVRTLPLGLAALATLASASASVARADHLTTIETLAPRPSLSARLVKKMTLLGDELDLRLGALTADLVRLHFDFASKTGNFHLGGVGDAFGLKLDGDVEVHHGITRIRARVDLGLGGERWVVDLPDVEMVPRGVDGAKGTELRLPVFEGRF